MNSVIRLCVYIRHLLNHIVSSYFVETFKTSEVSTNKSKLIQDRVKVSFGQASF